MREYDLGFGDSLNQVAAIDYVTGADDEHTIALGNKGRFDLLQIDSP